jgi:hypothetical protein
MGLSREQAREAVRFSLSRETREEEIDRVLEILPPAVAAVRAASAAAATATATDRPALTLALGVADEPVAAESGAGAHP